MVFKGKQLFILAVYLSVTALNAIAKEDVLANMPSAESVSIEEIAPSQISNAKDKDKDRVFWPMMPGETVEQLANKFYPDSPILKQRFIQKTLSFSRTLDLQIESNTQFKSPKMLIIPNEKAVREITHRIKKADDLARERDALKFAYQLKEVPTVTNTSPAVPVSIPKVAEVELPKPAQIPTPIPEVKAPTVLPKVESLEQKQVKPTATVKHKDQVISMNWPKIDLSQWQKTVSKQTNAIIDSAKRSMKQLNEQALILKQNYKGKSFQQVLNDYRLRNTLLIGLLAIIFFSLWILSRIRQRKQARMLGLIEDTIAPEPQEPSYFTIEIPAVKLDNTSEPTISSYEQKDYR